MAAPPNSTETAGTTPPASAGAGFWARALTLILLLANAQLWISRHLGELDFDWWGIPVGIAAIVGALKGLDWLFSESEKDEIKRVERRAKSILRRSILSLGFLVPAVCLSFLILLTFSSILVVDDDGNPIRTVKATRLAGASAFGAFRSHGRNVVPVTPFGRPYKLIAPGYLPRVVVVPPLTGVVLQASRDLRRTETAIVRLPSRTLPMIENGHRIRVWRGTEPVVDVTTHAGAVMIGPRVGIDAERMAFWELELSAHSVVDPVASHARLQWYRPEPVGGRVDLLPDDKLRATACLKVRTEAGDWRWKLVAEGSWTMLDGEATDVLLDWVEEERDCQP